MNQIDQIVGDLFDHLAPDEIDIMAQSFIRSTARMVTITKVGNKTSQVMDLMEDTEFRVVHFPAELRSLLRRNDVFLATMGFRDDRWYVLYLSRLYRT